MRKHFSAQVATGILALALSLGSVPPAIAAGSVITVPPPQVVDYWISVSRQPGGVLVFDGYAPSEAVRQQLSGTDGADITWLKLGSGAPTAYEAAVQFGLKTLQQLSEGRFALRGSVLSISGTAASQADFIALRQDIRAALPDGVILAMAEIAAPRVEAYTFSARRQSSGNIILSGYVPTPDLENTVLGLAGAQVSSTLRYASGEPVDFATVLAVAIPLLARLDEGEVRLEQGAWLLSGTPKSAADADAIRSAFTDNRLMERGWSLALATPVAPPAPVTVAAPAEPYRWTAQKTEAGVIMTGDLPTEAMQRVLALRFGASLSDETAVVPQPPEDFIAEALVAADILNRLSAGSVSFDGETWSVTGEAVDLDVSQVLSDAFGSADGWTIAVTTVAPPTAPEPAIAEVPAAPTTPEPAPTPAAPASAVVPSDPTPVVTNAAAIGLCRSTLAALSAENGILFRSGSAILVDEAGAALSSMAAVLARCPDAAIDVAGHTDSDGEAAANLALSVARAEAVVNALIALGTAPERLYAIGYGESQPIADNATTAGKTQNRRIVISIREAS